MYIEQLKDELDKCFAETDDFGKELLVAQARTLKQMRPASKPLLRLRLVSNRHGRPHSSNESHVLNLGQG